MIITPISRGNPLNDEFGTAKHPLLNTLRNVPRVEADLSPEGCVYDPASGAWRFAEDNVLWAKKPERRPPQTKKHDIETGEDQKGS